MIGSFADRDAEKLWSERLASKRLRPYADAALAKLMLLDAAVRADDLRVPPGNRLKLLEPKSAGIWQIRINGVHRIRFRWDCGNAQDVQIGDFHDDD